MNDCDPNVIMLDNMFNNNNNNNKNNNNYI
jgi:hypothetical protein